MTVCTPARQVRPLDGKTGEKFGLVDQDLIASTPRTAGEMKLNIRQRDELPRLSWCLSLVQGSATAQINCGPWVETGEDWFLEGAWDGDFSEPDFEKHCGLMGSGCRVIGRELILATPSHILDPLYLVLHEGRLTASNSLAFVLVATGLRLDPAYPYYQLDFHSSRYGFDRCVKELPTKDGPGIRLFRYTNIRLDDRLHVTTTPKPMPPDWKGFHDYREFLVDTLRALNDNANAPRRRIQYKLMSTMSSGYDSSAAAALAASVGGACAVTVKNGGDFQTRELTDDSGARVAEHLGLQITELPIVDFEDISDTARAECSSSGGLVELNFITFDRLLPRKLVTTGHTGNFWMGDVPPSSTFARMGPDGTGLAESRLRQGFIHVPVPMLGAVRGRRIHAICRSQEMKPWSVRRTYDRPVPRRILEESGVPRGLFARKKIGGIIVWSEYVPDAAVQFYFQHRSERSTMSRVLLAIRWRTTDWYCRTLALLQRFGLLKRPPRTHWDIPQRGPASMIVQWGQHVVQQRYRV